ncbi:MAG TPA: type II toxin-antitoxin system RelE/ParE family toxin [Alphaproteobacteria bacterium]|nr:type II toxin-antitoxin system RelE/ParE family toxin [Alphaproteobacteria bacterium]
MAEVRPLKLRYSARAQSQLISIGDYIRTETGPDLALRIGHRIREAAELLRYFPNAGRLGRVAGTREWVVRQAPYVIVYELVPADPAEIMVLGVFHCRQDRL